MAQYTQLLDNKKLAQRYIYSEINGILPIPCKKFNKECPTHTNTKGTSFAILYSPTAFGNFTGAFDLANSSFDSSLIEARVNEWYEHTRHEGDDGVRAWILTVFEHLKSCFGSVAHMIIVLTNIYVKSITYPMERLFILHDIAMSNHSPEPESSNLQMTPRFLVSRSEQAYFLYPYDFSQYFYVVISINNRVLFQIELPIDWKFVRRSEYGVYSYSTF
jgi:hypothetical protein